MKKSNKPNLVNPQLLKVTEPMINNLHNLPGIPSFNSGIKVTAEKMNQLSNSFGSIGSIGIDSIKQNIPDPPFVWKNYGKTFLRPMFWNVFGLFVIFSISYYLWFLATKTHEQRIDNLLSSYFSSPEEEQFDPTLIKPYNFFS